MNEIASVVADEPQASQVSQVSFEYGGTIGKVFEALAKAQGKGLTAEANQDNPAFKREGKPLKYADLAAVMAVFSAKVATEGLSIISLPATDPSNDKRVLVKTILGHTSGAYIAGTFSAMASGNNAQNIAAAKTYLVRHNTCAITGITVGIEDDDGNTASGTKVQQREEEGPRRPFGFINPDGKLFHSRNAEVWKKEWLTRIKAWAESGQHGIIEAAWKANADEIAATHYADEAVVAEVQQAKDAALTGSAKGAAPKQSAAAKPDDGPPTPTREAIPLVTPDDSVAIAKAKGKNTAQQFWLHWFKLAVPKFENHAALNGWLKRNEPYLAFVQAEFPDIATQAKTAVEEARGALDGFPPDTAKQQANGK